MYADLETLATTIVVPCYNEADRFDVDAFVEFGATRPWLTFLLVDDGSTDGTKDLLAAAVRRAPDRVGTLMLPENCGKAEAVRLGLLAAFESGAEMVGFWDADLATPLPEIDIFRRRFERQPDLEIAIGSRVQMLGTHIERKAARHYFGRVAATAVSLILGIAVYDTQCGAKLMRATPRVCGIFAEPFVTRWAFDVEILARWLLSRSVPPSVDVDRGLVEIPLDKWIDVAGSKLRLADFFGAPLALWRIYRQYGRALRQAR